MGYGKGIYYFAGDHRAYIKCKSIFESNHIFVSYAILFYGKWLFCQGLFCWKYDQKGSEKPAYSVFYCMYDIHCLVYGGGLAADRMDNLVHIKDKLIAMVLGMSRSSTILRDIHSVWLVWFVICLFAARILYVVVMKQIAELKLPVQLLIIFFISMVGIVIGKKYAYLPWSLDVALVSFPFLMAGDYLEKYELFKNKFNITMLVAGFMWIIPLGMKLHIELATRSYPMGPVCVLEAIGGSVCVAGFFCFLEKKGITSSALSWLGRNSMVVLAVHCLEMMYFDWDRYMFSVLPVADMWWMAAGVKVVGIVVVAWIVVVVRDMVKRKNNT